MHLFQITIINNRINKLRLIIINKEIYQIYRVIVRLILKLIILIISKMLNIKITNFL